MSHEELFEADPKDSGRLTSLLQSAGRGNREAMNRLMPLVYEELQVRAAAQLRRERPNHTLQTTAVVHEAYLRLIDQQRAEWKDRAHFFAMAATCMRRILVDHARKKVAAKRGGGQVHVALEAEDLGTHSNPEGFITLHECLTRFDAVDHRKAQVLELRYFGGLQNDEIGAVLSISVGTVERDLRLARAWLRRELTMEGV